MRLKKRYWAWRDGDKAIDVAVHCELGIHYRSVTLVLAAFLCFTVAFTLFLMLMPPASLLWVVPLTALLPGYAIFCELTIGLGALRLGWNDFARNGRIRRFVLDRVKE